MQITRYLFFNSSTIYLFSSAEVIVAKCPPHFAHSFSASTHDIFRFSNLYWSKGKRYQWWGKNGDRKWSLWVGHYSSIVFYSQEGKMAVLIILPQQSVVLFNQNHNAMLGHGLLNTWPYIAPSRNRDVYVPRFRCCQFLYYTCTGCPRKNYLELSNAMLSQNSAKFLIITYNLFCFAY